MLKMGVFPLSAFDGRMPVVSQEFRPPKHKGVDIDYRATSEDPTWPGPRKPSEQRTQLFYFPPAGVVVVRATAPGVVRISHKLPNGGSVRVQHGSELATLYLHLARRFVVPDERVTEGQPLGLAGVPGPGQFGHLHYEVRGPGETPLDPVPLLEGATVLDNAGGVVGPFAQADGSGRRPNGVRTDGGS